MKNFFLFLLFLSLNASAQQGEVFQRVAFRIDSLPPQGILLDKGWKWHAGDNPDFAKVDFDDSKWESIDPTKDIMDLPQVRKAGIGWLRLNLHIDSTLLQQQAITLLVGQTAASELYSDGQLILRLGTVSPNADEVDAVSTTFHSFGLPGVGKSTYALAVRIAFQPNLPYTKFGNVPNTLYRVRVRAVSQLDPFSPLSQRRYNFLTYTFVKAGLFFILALLHLCFFIFYPLKKANLFFSISSLLFFLHWLVLGLRNTSLLSDLDTMMYVGQLRAVLFPVNYICLVTALYTAYALPKSYYYWAGVGVCGLLIVIYFLNYQSGVPWIEIGSTIVMTAEAIRITVMAVVRKHRGVNIILIGLVFSFVGLSMRYLTEFTSLLPYFRINDYASTFDNFGVLSLPLFLSVYLASEFAFASKSLAAQLVAVKQLSAQTLAQEQEKKQILATQNETLEKQVAERTAELVHKNRDLEIEAALERVRARTMAMQKSEELAEVSYLLNKQVVELGIPTWGCAFNIYNENDSTEWFSNLEGTFPAYQTPRENIFLEYYEAGQRGESFLIEEFGGERIKELYKYFATLNDAGAKEEAITNHVANFPDYQINHMAYFKYGYLLFITLVPSPEAHEIFVRFAREFEQTYTRFLDLQKAEAQARESQIQLALERVRARTMAMHHSSELANTATILFQQIKELGFEIWSCEFGIWRPEIDLEEAWMSTGDLFPIIMVPFREDPTHLSIYEASQRGESVFEVEVKGEVLTMHYDWLMSQPSFKIVFGQIENSGIILPTVQYKYAAFFKQGYLHLITTKPQPDIHNINQRFAKVFEQTYTRFLDLQKAEAQAREAQIEVAVERVRAKALAMHKSAEIMGVAVTMRIELETLNMPGFDAATITLIQDDGTIRLWDNTSAKQHEDGTWENTEFIFRLEDNNPDFYLNKIWSSNDRYIVVEQDEHDLKITTDWVRRHDKNLADVVVHYYKENGIKQAWHPAVALTYGRLNLDFYVHAPEPEVENILIKMAAAFDLSYKRFLDLQKAEAQAREAEIQLALERVRARTMAMHQSDELRTVAALLFEQMNGLGFETSMCSIVLLNKETRSYQNVVASHIQSVLPKIYNVPYFKDAVNDRILGAFDEGVDYKVIEFAGVELREFQEKFFTLTDFRSVPEETKQVMINMSHCSLCSAYMKHGSLETIGAQALSKEQAEILQRFAKVFEQTYTRFLDLQKAEAQARESQIQLGLERVRARTMAMHKSAELAEVAVVLYHELKALGVSQEFFECGYVEIDEAKNLQHAWSTRPDGSFLEEQFYLPLTGDAVFDARYEAWKKRVPVFHQAVGGDELKRNIEFTLPYFGNKEAMEIATSSLIPDTVHFYCGNFSHGYLSINCGMPLSLEAESLLARVTGVFEMTYKRFLDLKKAEEQAREAEIETALERVRSRSLAMQSPVELMEVAQLLRVEMGALGVEELETSSIYIYEENSGLTQCWFTIKNVDNRGVAISDQMIIDLKDTWVGREMDTFFKSAAMQTSIVMEGDNRIEWIRYCENKSTIFTTKGFYGDRIPKRTYHLQKFSNGFIGAASPGEISKESWHLLSRATAVFSFAYTRFMDLQKAEASARSALRQASLDRVRADISSMRSAEDLDRITPLIFTELTTLGVAFIRCGVFIVHEKSKMVEVHLATPEGKSLAIMNMPFGANDLTARSVEAWEKGEVYIQQWSQADFVNFGKSLVEQGFVHDIKGYQGTETPPESLYLHFFPFAQGLLYVGSTTSLVADQMDLIKSLARAFATAYARYEDFKQLEAAKKSVDAALRELQATQKQLIQSEKLASLGELTAGIAHEIQNPLNFVNNFSELSVELVSELLEERNKEYGLRDEALEKDLLNDLAQNQEKINLHGKRASSIVKGMLEHSRASTGVKELTDINQLADEYLRLAYHGLRAKNQDFNTDYELITDKNLPKVEVVPQEIGRVLLNLINNAFYAVNQRAKQGDPNYQPKVIVTTKHSPIGGWGAVCVQDNGSGIPDNIKAKIFQPFFTTKPTGQGTGLGLSLAYDIVTKGHGGTIECESVEGEGTTFVVKLPIQ